MVVEESRCGSARDAMVCLGRGAPQGLSPGESYLNSGASFSAVLFLQRLYSPRVIVLAPLSI